MENSLVFSHLPWQFSHHRSLAHIRELSEPPPLREVAAILSEHAKSTKDVWVAIDSAREQAEHTMKALKKFGINVVDYWSMHYPQSLRLIDHPPWSLFFIGQLPATSVPTIAVVGTRKPNTYGAEVLASIIPYLVTRPLQLISGLAYGIDALSHYHACQAQIPNFAVMGCGLDILYPHDHEQLAAEILKSNGGLLSEFPPGTAPLPRNFPRRNRIIAGLANAVWIVQGTAKSGTLHTVEHALKQGKTVVATPGDIFNALSELPNRLLYDGAQMVVKASDIDLLLHRAQAIVTH